MEVLKKVLRAPRSCWRSPAVDTPDPLTRVFRLGHPAPYLLMALSGYDTPILSKSSFENADPAANPTANKPIGPGRTSSAAWGARPIISGSDRNPNYCRAAAYLDHIVGPFIPDASTTLGGAGNRRGAIRGLQLGELLDVKRLQANPHGAGHASVSKRLRNDRVYKRDRRMNDIAHRLRQTRG